MVTVSRVVGAEAWSGVWYWGWCGCSLLALSVWLKAVHMLPATSGYCSSVSGAGETKGQLPQEGCVEFFAETKDRDGTTLSYLSGILVLYI